MRMDRRGGDGHRRTHGGRSGAPVAAAHPARWLLVAAVVASAALVVVAPSSGSAVARDRPTGGAAASGAAASGAAASGATASDPGCDPSRRAVPHGAGGVHAAASGSRPFPCLFDTGARALEPTFGIDRGGRIFYQAAEEAELPFADAPRVLRSTDGGSSWEDVSPRLAGRGVHAATFDPYLHLDSATQRLYTVDALVACASLSSSDEGGEGWSSAVVACGQGVDHQSVFTAPPTVSPTVGYPNVVYWCAVHGGGGQFSTATMCSKSLDGGRSFAPTGSLPYTADPSESDGNFGIAGYCDGLAGRGAGGADGTIYLPKGWCGLPTLAISEDEGATWRRVVVDEERGMARTRDDRPDHEANVAVDGAGNLYFVWAGRDRLPYLSISVDGGSTWSEPSMVAPPELVEVDRPDVAVGDAGRLVITYMGSESSPGAPFPGEGECGLTEGATPLGSCDEPSEYADVTWNGYMTVSGDVLGPDPRFFTVSVNDPTDPLHRGACGPGGCGSLGDGISTAQVGPDGIAYGAFVDLCPAGCPADAPGETEATPLGLLARLAGGPDLRG